MPTWTHIIAWIATAIATGLAGLYIRLHLWARQAARLAQQRHSTDMSAIEDEYEPPFISCSSCVYSMLGIDDDGTAGTMICVHSPPTVWVEDHETRVGWPQVDEEMSCGQWRGTD